jgi:hypothetical protein
VSSPDVNDTIQSLSRIAQAAARMMADLHYRRRLADVEGEVPHMRANLDRITTLLDSASRKP